MHEEERFKKRIYEYCENNPGRDILFPGFTNLWISSKQITSKNLTMLTSVIVSDLIKQKIIIQIPNNYENFYPMYRILPNEKLIDY